MVEHACDNRYFDYLGVVCRDEGAAESRDSDQGQTAYDVVPRRGPARTLQLDLVGWDGRGIYIFLLID